MSILWLLVGLVVGVLVAFAGIVLMKNLNYHRIPANGSIIIPGFWT